MLESVREKYPDLPSILYTGKGSEEVAAEAMSAGVTDYLQKDTGTGQYTVLANRIRNAVSARQSAVEADRRSHRLEQILKTVPGCVVQLTPDGQFVFANERAEEVLGLDKNELTDRAYNDPEWRICDLNGNPIPDEDLPFRRVRDSGEPVRGLKHTIQWPDGTQKVLLVNGAPLFDENGAIDSVVFSLTDITDQESRERELQKTRRRLELALETTDTGVWEWNLETDEVVWNESLERTMGLAPGEFEGTFEAFVDRVHPDDLPRVRDQIEHTIETDSMYRIEFRIRHADGSYRWVEVRGRTIRDSEGDRMIGIHHDVTGRKEREQELRRSRKRYRTLVDHFPNGGVFLYDGDLRCILAGGQELSDLGLTPADIHGERPEDRYPADIAEEIETNLRRAFDGEHTEFEQSYNGRRYQVQTVPVGEPPIDNAMAVSHNITDRKQYEQKLTALHNVATDLANAGSTEEVHERTIAASKEILAFGRSVIDVEKNGILSKTASSEEIPPENLVDMSIEEGIAGKTYRTQTSHLIDDSHTHEEANPQGPYRSALSIPIGDHGVFQAVAENPAAFDTDDLELAELLISHATSAVHRLDRNRALERKNERLEEFARIVSHDLRSPLSVLQGRLDLAREECDSDHLDAAENALTRSQALINDLLTLAREGQQVNELSPVSLATAVENGWRTVETAEGTLIIELNSGRSIRADKSRLTELLENLIRNAIEHGGEDVTVTVGDLEDGFYIADDGPGIPEEAREMVFKTGYSTADDGTGFGLEIVRGIVEAHGWEIRVTEGRQGGARFEITGVTHTSS